MVKAKLHGFPVELDLRDWLEGQFYFHPFHYERPSQLAVKQNLREGQVFVDCGSHLGFFSLLAARILGPKGQVIAIEANPAIYHRLVTTMRSNQLDLVSTVHSGVSDQQETLSFRIDPKNSGASGRTQDTQDDQTIQVDCKPLGEILEAKGLTKVDFLKIDLEGMECQVMSHLLENYPQLAPSYALGEYYPDRDLEGQHNLIRLMTSRGYQVKKLRGPDYLFYKESPAT